MDFNLWRGHRKANAIGGRIYYLCFPRERDTPLQAEPLGKPQNGREAKDRSKQTAWFGAFCGGFCRKRKAGVGKEIITE